MTETNNKQNRDLRFMAVSRDASLLQMLGSLARPNSGGKAPRWETVSNGWDAMELAQASAAPQLLLLDIPRGDVDSLHFMRRLRRLRPEIFVLVICHPEDAGQGHEAARIGAKLVLTRPVSEAQLQGGIDQILGAGDPEKTAAAPALTETSSVDAFFLGKNPVMQNLRSRVELLAQNDVPILIVGEKGSGKKTVARLLHQLSVRSGFKLLRLHCEETPAALLEAELFGAEAAGERGHLNLGGFAVGETGTVFLDEISALPPALQSRLLQVFRTQESLAASNPAPAAAARIIAASSVNPDRALADGRLREDLYYRLSAFTLQVPPLRQRKDEIAILLRYFMHKLAKHYHMPSREFSAAVIEACENHAWPGNMAEMETFVKRYLVAGDRQLPGTQLPATQLPATQTTGTRAKVPQPPLPGMVAVKEEAGEGTVVSLSLPLPLPVPAFGSPAGRTEIAVAPYGAPGSSAAKPESLKSLIQNIKCEAEQNAIGAALRRTGWNRKAAARLLRVSYRTLLYKIEQYQMRAPERLLGSALADFPVYASEGEDDGRAS